ncbi:MAG: hypothetical protein AAGG68_11925 [Bacteroidota bacterium]
MATTSYYYLPHLRRGLGATQTQLSDDGKRVLVDVNLGIQSNSSNAEVVQQVGLYGPGDVLGFDANRAIVKTEPKRNIGDFEPNYIPFVEFVEEDFPWRYSTRKASGDNWIPWLTLIVLKAGDGVNVPPEFELKAALKDGLPSLISVEDTAVLPNLEDAWKWAHVQVVGEQNGAQIQEKIKQHPEYVVARLLAPRYLEAGVKYCAFVVPTYKQSVEAALGQAIEAKADTFAWERSGGQSLTLPYYFKWEFSTGLRGDFEYLVRLLEPRILTDLGKRKIDCANLGVPQLDNFVINPDVPANSDEKHTLEMEGAIQSQNTQFQEWGMDSNDFPNDFQEKLQEFLNLNEGIEEDEDEDPIVLPPNYGGWYLNRADGSRAIKSNSENWHAELNLDPRHRAAAGLGVEIVKKRQEALMETAWKQLEQFDRVNRQLNRAQFGRAVGGCMHKRLEQFKGDDLLRITRKVGTKLVPEDDKLNVGGKNGTLKFNMQESSVPDVLANPSARKFWRGIGAKKSSADASAQLFAKSAVTNAANLEGETVNPFLVPEVTFEGTLPTTQALAPQVISNANIKVDDIDDLRKQVLGKINPVATIENQTAKRIAKYRNYEAAQGRAKPADELCYVKFYPRFKNSTYKFLIAESQDYLLPGIERVPQNSVAKLEVNPRFIEAFLMGLNHEFAEELRWREYPTDMRGSYFSRFWDYLDDKKKDIQDLTTWKDADCLGDHQAQNAKHTILFIRGDLIKKYPNTYIYVLPAKQVDGKNVPDYSKAKLVPDFEGQLPEDVVFLGYTETLDDHFVVFEERLGELRFGLDEIDDTNIPAEVDINDLAWQHFGSETGSYLNITNQAPTVKNEGATLALDRSSKIARALSQKPVRLAIDIDLLIE